MAIKMEIIIIGDGGHSKVIQEIISEMRKYKLVAVLDDRYECMERRNNRWYGPITTINKIIKATSKVVLAIGDNTSRMLINRNLMIRRDQYETIIHPSAVVSPSASLGFGTVVMPRACINAHATIGNHCIINTGAVIE